MSTQSLRNTSAAIFLLAAGLAFSQDLFAECPNPELPYTIIVTGPVEDCVDAVEDTIDSSSTGCPHYCNICERSWGEEQYTLQYEGCRVVPDNPFKSESGEITCNCDLLIEG